MFALEGTPYRRLPLFILASDKSKLMKLLGDITEKAIPMVSVEYFLLGE